MLVCRAYYTGGNVLERNADTHKYASIRGDAGVGVIDAVNATVVEHARCIATVNSSIRKVDGIGFVNPGRTSRHARLA